MSQQELIPGLPEDIARECLIRIPFKHFGSTRFVCKLWKQEIESEYYHAVRKLRKMTRTIITFAQADPAFASAGPANKYALMSYKLTVFDPLSATWHSLPPVPGSPRGLPLFCQLAAAGREVVVVGGWDPETWAPLATVYVYSFVTGAWRAGAPMPGPKRSFFACAGSGGTVFVAGGHDEEKNALRSAMAYDVAGDRWVPMPDMALERDECKGVFLRGRFCVIGGYATERQGRFCRSVESFDVDAWRWGPVEDMLDAAMCPRTCAAGGDGRAYMCRGGHVSVVDGDTWRNVGEVPEDAGVAPTLVMWQGKMVLIGSGSHGGAQEAYVSEVGGNKKMTWQKVEVPFEFSGHVQAACCLET